MGCVPLGSPGVGTAECGASANMDPMAADPALVDLLRELDDPDCLERPQGFDPQVASRRFNELRASIEDAFACEAAVDAAPDVQDASFFGRLEIPAPATASGLALVVVVSNFWPLVVVALESPGAYDEAERGRLLDDLDRVRLDRALLGSGHVLVPEHLLDHPYDGASSAPSIRTWFVRYFDYL